MTVNDDNYRSPLSVCYVPADLFVRVAWLVNDGTDKDSRLVLKSLGSTAIIRPKATIAFMSSQSDGRDASCPLRAWAAHRVAGRGLRVIGGPGPHTERLGDLEDARAQGRPRASEHRQTCTGPGNHVPSPRASAETALRTLAQLLPVSTQQLRNTQNRSAQGVPAGPAHADFRRKGALARV